MTCYTLILYYNGYKVCPSTILATLPRAFIQHRLPHNALKLNQHLKLMDNELIHKRWYYYTSPVIKVTSTHMVKEKKRTLSLTYMYQIYELQCLYLSDHIKPETDILNYLSVISHTCVTALAQRCRYACTWYHQCIMLNTVRIRNISWTWHQFLHDGPGTNFFMRLLSVTHWSLSFSLIVNGTRVTCKDCIEHDCVCSIIYR